MGAFLLQFARVGQKTPPRLD